MGVLARSEAHSSLALEATEQIEFHTRSLNEGGDQNPRVRADIVLDQRGQGAAFSVGSVAWAASLSADGYDNDVSRITQNVIDRFIASPSPEQLGVEVAGRE
jgi:N,N-dimethylformamidase